MEKQMETTIGFRVQDFGFMVGMMKWKRNGNYSNELYRDWYKDPFLHS